VWSSYIVSYTDAESTASNPTDYLDLCLQDIEKTYGFAKSQHPIRIRRLSVVGRLVEEILAAMLTGFGYTISSTKQADGSNAFDRDLVLEFQDSVNPLKRALGSDQVQQALQDVVDAKVGMNQERTSREAVQFFIRSFELAIPALRSAVAACKTSGEYGANDDAEAGPAWEGTTLPSDGPASDPRWSGGRDSKPSAGWSGTTLPSG
jgi:hypothetical protein